MSQAESLSVDEAEVIGKVILVSRHLIRPFPNQPREYFDATELASLARSIGKWGQLVPAFVKELHGQNGCAQKYELTDGQRRWHALAMAGVEKMKVIVKEVRNEDDQFLQSVMANFGRAEHTPVEIAKAIGRFKAKGMSETEIADIFAKSQSWVNMHYKILKLVPEVLEMMSPTLPEEERLLFCTATMLADMPKDLQLATAKIIVKRKLKINQARSLIRQRAARMGFKVGDPTRKPSDDYRNLCNFLARIRRELEIFEEMPQDFFDKMFQFREDEDWVKVSLAIELISDKVTSLKSGLARARKKK
jgi:ParB family chromosome partitioning protein